MSALENYNDENESLLEKIEFMKKQVAGWERVIETKTYKGQPITDSDLEFSKQMLVADKALLEAFDNGIKAMKEIFLGEMYNR